MKRICLGLLYGLGGYLVTAPVAYFLILHFSSNVHDRSVEAAMTSIFVCGPTGTLAACILGVIRGGRTSDRTARA
jgi:hypothetical protein